MSAQLIDQIIRSKRRTLGLQINAQAELIVRAPQRISMDEILRVVNKQLNWIRKHQARRKLNLGSKKEEHEYREGEKFLYLGNFYPLKIESGSPDALVFNENEFVLNQASWPKAKELFHQWYKKRSESHIIGRAAALAKIVGSTPTSIRISPARSRWGSCSRRGRLNFSWRLIMAPQEVIDYVIFHELAHLTHHNHSPAFWEKVHEFYPNHKEARLWLKVNQSRMDI